jgi:hypothetical protein
LRTGWRDWNGCLRTLVITILKLPDGSFTFLQCLSGTELLTWLGHPIYPVKLSWGQKIAPDEASEGSRGNHSPHWSLSVPECSPEQEFVLGKDMIVSLLKRDRWIFKLILDNLARYLQSEVAILLTALTTSCKDFIRETSQRTTWSVHQGTSSRKPGLLDDFFRNGNGAARKGDGHFEMNPTSTFRAVFEE